MNRVASAPSCSAFIHRVALEEVSGHRVLIKSKTEKSWSFAINQLLNPQAWEWQSSLESVWCREPPGLVPGLLDSGLNSARSLLWVLVCLASLNTDFFSLSGWGR